MKNKRKYGQLEQELTERVNQALNQNPALMRMHGVYQVKGKKKPLDGTVAKSGRKKDKQKGATLDQESQLPLFSLESLTKED